MATERLVSPTALARLPLTEKQTFFYHFHEAEINFGCGSRPCRICCYSAPKYTSSLPSRTIKEIHSMKQEIAPAISFWHFRAGDPFYWRDSKMNETYADIAIDAYEKGLNPTIQTHGWLPDEEIPQIAASRLVEWASKQGRKNLVNISIDPYGFIDIPPEIRDASVSLTVAMLEPILRSIDVFYNPQDKDFTLQKMQEISKLIIPSHLHSKIKFDSLFTAGRTRTLDQKPTEAFIPSTIGYSLRHDGRIVFTPEMNGVESTQGTIFTEIKTPLPHPIPRPPDFDYFG